MKILVNWPTRGRPSKFINNIVKWIANASYDNDITYLVKIDRDDKIMNVESTKKYISDHLVKDYPNQRVILQILDTNTKIQAINAKIGDQDFDVVVCAADDIEPRTSNWDKQIAKDAILDKEMCINYNIDDRMKNFRDLVIMPIFTRKLYDRFKYIYHPLS